MLRGQALEQRDDLLALLPIANFGLWVSEEQVEGIKTTDQRVDAAIASDLVVCQQAIEQGDPRVVVGIDVAPDGADCIDILLAGVIEAATELDNSTLNEAFEGKSTEPGTSLSLMWKRPLRYRSDVLVGHSVSRIVRSVTKRRRQMTMRHWRNDYVCYQKCILSDHGAVQMEAICGQSQACVSLVAVFISLPILPTSNIKSRFRAGSSSETGHCTQPVRSQPALHSGSLSVAN